MNRVDAQRLFNLLLFVWGEQAVLAPGGRSRVPGGRGEMALLRMVQLARKSVGSNHHLLRGTCR